MSDALAVREVEIADEPVTRRAPAHRIARGPAFMAGRVRPALLIAVAVAAALGCGHAARPATPRFDAEPWIDAEQRSLIVRSYDHARRMLAETRVACDLSPLWTEPGHRAECSNIARSDDHPCGADRRRLYAILAEEEQPALVRDESAPMVGLYTGPLFVLVDSHTASAAEQFLSHLKTAGRGIVIGRPTLGAGCGYTNGGLNVVLASSGLRIRMPDCVRYLHDGENEVAGIVPDIALDTRDFEAPAFLARVLATLDHALAAPQ
jgi:hypothetical protein